MSQQHPDGGWHSATYGQLRDGAAVTALALYAAAHLPHELRRRHHPRLQGGYEFLRPGIAKQGCAAAPDGTMDYPAYASAMTLVAVRKLTLAAPAEELARLEQFLVDAQLTERNGFQPDDVNYGGWDMLGGSGAYGVTSGTNVSVTRFALEALRQSDRPSAQAALARAGRWIDGCQNRRGDGGFVFHPEPEHLGNKAGWNDPARTQPRSYGSTTCDGLLCLRWAGAEPDDPRVQAAVAWLVRNAEVETVPGFGRADGDPGWKTGLWFYYAAGLSHVLADLPADVGQQLRNGLSAALVSRQHPDGRWQNASNAMREDDPLIATCLALVALCAAP